LRKNGRHLEMRRNVSVGLEIWGVSWNRATHHPQIRNQ
jgi:hypothetical protein